MSPDYDTPAADSLAEAMADIEAASVRADSLNDVPRKQAEWRPADVYAYKTALKALGFDETQIARQIEKDCGVPYAQPGFLRMRQAS